MSEEPTHPHSCNEKPQYRCHSCDEERGFKRGIEANKEIILIMKDLLSLERHRVAELEKLYETERKRSQVLVDALNQILDNSFKWLAPVPWQIAEEALKKYESMGKEQTK